MKRLLFLIIILFTIFFSISVVAQELGSLRKGYEVSFPEKIQSPLGPPLAPGTYTIGTGGYFPTIDSAFKKLSVDGIAGEIVLELIDNLYTAPTTQYGFLLNGPIPGSSSRVTIKPAANKNVVIQGNSLSTVTFNNTNYITIDGVSLTGTTTLTIHTLYNAQFVWNSCLNFYNNSDYNVIQNVSFISEDYTRYGEVIGFSTQAGFNVTADNNLIQNNFIKKGGIAIYVSAYESSTKAVGNIIRGNKVGSETDSLIAWGIQAEHNQNAIIENNIVQNIRYYNNYINPGINSYYGDGDIIRNNIVYNIYASGGQYGGIGILLSGETGRTGSNNLVYNNMIYDIRSSATLVAGIAVWSQNNPKIYYNSVYLVGTGNGANPLGSAALYIRNSCTNVEVKNNILVNTRNESPYCASAIYSYGYGIMPDYNDLFYEPTQYNSLVRIGSTKYKTLTDWQAIGKDFHSTSVMPCFCSPDLHIDCTMATCLEKRGTPIAGFDTDFDGDLRNVNLPDIGADEFAGMIPTGALSFGAYSVGTTGFFPSIESVFNRLSTDGVAGPITLELTDNLYTAPTDSFGFKMNGPIPGAEQNSRVTIKPAANKNVILEGNGRFVITFWNISHLNFNGVSDSGSTTLTIHSNYNTQFDVNRCLGLFNNSDHNTIQNIILIGEDIYRYGDLLVVAARQNSLFAPDSNLIQYNFIKKGGGSIYLTGLFAGGNVRPTGNIIRGNHIGSETDSLINWGIQVEKCKNTIVENNVVQNLKIQNAVGEQVLIGINSYVGLGDTIRNNIVHNIKASFGYTSVGILLSGGNDGYGSNNSIYNNMVYDIQSTSTTFDSRVAGIQAWYQNNPKVYYNSVNLTGTGSNKYGSAAFYISESCTNVEAKNNIFVNTRDESPYCASAIYDYSASNLTTDYNDLYNESNTYNALARIGSLKYKTLADWQATGKDLHSVTEMPNFINPPDLHIFAGLSYLESRGTPIVGIDKDFDLQTRNALTPDIGADEFNGVVVGIEDETTLPTEFALMQNYPNPFNPSTKISWQSPVGSWQTLKVYDVLGNEVATLVDEEKPAGVYELNWNASQLSSGVYFYQLKAGEYKSVRKMILLK